MCQPGDQAGGMCYFLQCNQRALGERMPAGCPSAAMHHQVSSTQSCGKITSSWPTPKTEAGPARAKSMNYYKLCICNSHILCELSMGGGTQQTLISGIYHNLALRVPFCHPSSLWIILYSMSTPTYLPFYIDFYIMC